MSLYDPFAHTVADDPYPVYRSLRAEFPVYHCEERDCWVLSRFEDVQQGARDWKHLSNEAGVELDQPGHYLGPGDFLEWDPPRHDRMRAVLHEYFKPKVLAGLEEVIRDRVGVLIEPILAAGEGDMAAQLAFPLPMLTILNLLGFPEEDAPVFRRLMADVVERTPGTQEKPLVALEAENSLGRAALDAVEERRRKPQEDLLTAIAQAAADGRLEEEEIPGICLLLLIAGWETTAGLLSSSFLHLATHAGQREILLADPTLIPRAVEEVMRFDAPVQHLARISTEDIALHGVTIPAGERVLLLWGSANRDERRWERADEFDVLRPPQRHVGFGEGIHHCLGAPLARLEGRIALEIMLAKAPEYVVDGEIKRLNAHVVRGLERLPVRL